MRALITSVCFLPKTDDILAVQFYDNNLIVRNLKKDF